MRRPRKLVGDSFKNLAKLTTDLILENKFDRDQANHLLGTTKVRSASTRTQAGSGTPLSKHQALLPQDGNRLRGGSLLHGHRHQSGVSDLLFFFDKSRYIATGNDDSLVSDGECEHHTQPTRISAHLALPHTIFLVWLKGLTAQDHMKCCVPHENISSSHPSIACRTRLPCSSQMSTTSLSTLSTCTPVRPSTRPSTRPLLTLSSHGDYTCADSSNVSFGLVPESTSPT